MSDTTDDRKPHPYLRVWVSDIVLSCHMMTPAQFGAHMRMILHAWDRGSCPADPERLQPIVGNILPADLGEVLERWQRLTLDDGRVVLINRRLERERQSMITQAAARTEAALKANRARWDAERQQRELEQRSVDPNGSKSESDRNPTTDSRLQTSDARPQTPEVSSVGDKTPTKPRKRRINDDPFSWSEPTGWIGVTDADHDAWADLYPAVDSRYELKRLDRWLRDNPTKAHKSHWRRWLNKLFGIKQDKGGSSGGKVEPIAAPRRHEPDRSHIPEDCAPGQDHLFWDGTFPNIPSTYTDTAGNLRHTRTRKIICAAEA